MSGDLAHALFDNIPMESRLTTGSIDFVDKMKIMTRVRSSRNI